MAEVAVFHYHPGSGFFHRLDPRLKVLLVIAYIAAVLRGSVAIWSITSLLFLPVSRSAGLHPGTFRRELRVFGLLAVFIFLGRTAGALAGIPPAVALQAALFSTWRFLLIAWLGIILAAVLSPVELHAVVFWLLKPLPGIPAGRIAAHSSFSLVLLPRLLDTVHEIREARRARGIERCRNPLVRIRSLIYPLLDKLILEMEEFSLALETRCFDENVVRVRFHVCLHEVLMWGLAVLPAAGMLFLTFID